MNDKDLIPMRWPDDPGWQKPEMLGMIHQGTPINCLLVAREWPLRELAEKLNFRVMTLGEDPLISLDKVKSGQTGIVAVNDATWPSIASPQENGGGPTGNAWVESNGWRIRLVRAKAPQAIIWMDAAPPKDKVVRPEQYGLAVADASAYGARWIINFGPDVVKGLISENQDARRAGAAVIRTLRFFEFNRAWREYSAIGKLAVVSDFTGPNEFFGNEVLNLAPRRQLPHRIFDSTAAPNLTGVKAVLWVNEKAPTGPWASALDTFVQDGGKLIVPASNAHLTKGLATAGNFDNRYDLYTKGKGRIAVSRKPWSDPYEIASDAHLLLGRPEDMVRLWNGSSTNLYCTESNGKCIVHVLNYAVRTNGSPLSFWIDRPYKTARFHEVTNDDPKKLEVVSRYGGAEVAIPDFLCYGAIELGEAL